MLCYGGSKDFWGFVPKNVNAVTVCSQNEIKFYAQGYGHYSNYTDDYRGPERVPNGTTIDQHWFISSIHKALSGIKLDCIVDLHAANTKSIIYRPKTKKKILDLDDIDWSLIPTWASKILCVQNINKINYQTDIQIGDAQSYIDHKDIIRTHYIRNDHTRPAEDIDDKFGYNNFNYEIKNIPAKNKIFVKPKK